MADLWLIFGFGLFMDGLVSFWVVWMVCVCVRVCVCVLGGGSSGVLVSKRSILSYQQYIFFFEAETILRSLNPRLGKIDTFLMFIITRKFKQKARGFNMLLSF